MSHDTIVAISTAPGAAAVGIVRVSGEDAHGVVSGFFRAYGNKQAEGFKALLGEITDGDRVIDEAIALYFFAPCSYTGEHVVELQCHGNDMLLQQVMELAVRHGARPAGAGEFTKRAFLNGKLSLAKAEAVSALIEGEGRRGLAAAADALSGVLGRRLQHYREQICELSADIAAACDYPDDVDILPEGFLQRLHTLQSDLSSLYQDSAAGLNTDRGIKTVIAGRPNVGKSTILNLLCGFDRAIVSDVAGTTRDIVEQRVDIDGAVLLLSDTAGIHETDDEVEKEGIRRSKTALQEAGLILAVFDAQAEPDIELCEQLCDIHAPILAVINKIDKGNKTTAESLARYFDNIVSISATSSEATSSVKDAIKSGCIDIPSDDAMLLATHRQAGCCKNAATALQEAGAALQNGMYDVCGIYVDEAHSALCELMLLDATEETVGSIFSRFCIGK